MKRLISISFLSFSLAAIGQNVTIDYQAWNPSGTTCNLFVNPTNVPATGTASGNIEHQRKLGESVYNNSDLSIQMQTTFQTNGAVQKGARYRIAYNFKAGYSYIIYVTTAAVENTVGFTTGPYIRLDVNNNGGGGSTGCNGPETLSASTGGNPAAVQLSSNSFQEFQFVFLQMGTQPTLEVTAFPANNGGTKTVRIRKIRIVETPPAANFAITPNPIPVTCGLATPVTLTVNNNGGTTGITDYTWNLGATPNNWLLNGNPAPETYSTGTTNTLSLTPVCGTTPSNISATVTAGGNSFQTNTATISISNPTLSINGNANFCTGTSNYSINNLPCNASVSWSASPGGVVSLSCTSCPSITLTKLADGVVTLSATITKTNACSSGTETKDLTITVAAPKIIYTPSGQEAYNLTGQRFNYGANGPGKHFSVCPGEYLTFTPYFPSGYNPPTITAHQWTISGNYSSVGSLTQNYISVTSASSHPNAFNFTYQYQNACGWSPEYNGSAGTMDCDNGEEPFRVHRIKILKEELVKPENLATIFPNPVNDVLNIAINPKDVGMVTIKLYNALGKEVKKVIAISPLTSLNISGLTKGIYFIQILDGRRITTHKVIKN